MDPSATVQRIGRKLYFEMTLHTSVLAKGDKAQVGHAIASDRIRMSGTTQASLEWQEKLSLTDRSRFWGLAVWLAGGYGYETQGGFAIRRTRNLILLTIQPVTKGYAS